MLIRIGNVMNRMIARTYKLAVFGGAHKRLDGHVATVLRFDERGASKQTAPHKVEVELELPEAVLLRDKLDIAVAQMINLRNANVGLPEPWEFCDDCGRPVDKGDQRAVRFKHEGAAHHWRTRCVQCEVEVRARVQDLSATKEA